MAVRRATGKKSVAISDRSGFKVPYKSLKTTWDGLRVEPEEYEPKHPQLTPARNVVDATALFDPRPDNDPENVEIMYGFSFDPFIDRSQRPPVGIPAFGRTGFSTIIMDSDVTVTGVAATGALGTFTLFISLDVPVTGVAATGAIGTEGIELNATPSSAIGTGAIGTSAGQSEVGESGVAATGAIGTEGIELAVEETGVAATGNTEGFGVSGNGNIMLTVTGISGIASVGNVGEEVAVAEVIETGLAGTGAIGTISIEVNFAWGESTFGTGTWGR